VYFKYICWKFAGRLLDRVNIPLAFSQTPVYTARPRDYCIARCACSRTGFLCLVFIAPIYTGQAVLIWEQL